MLYGRPLTEVFWVGEALENRNFLDGQSIVKKLQQLNCDVSPIWWYAEPVAKMVSMSRRPKKWEGQQLLKYVPKRSQKIEKKN